MLKRFFLSIILAAVGLASPVYAQGCGPSNPSCLAPTAPFGTNNNQIATTAFVLGNTIPITPTATLGKVIISQGLGINPIWSVSPQLGTGDSTYIFNPTTPQTLNVLWGTAASPDLQTKPVVQISRTIKYTGSASGDGGEQFNALKAVTTASDATQTAPTVGVFGGGNNSGTSTAGCPPLCGLYPDAIGIYGIGMISGVGAIGHAIGVNAQGTRTVTTGLVSSIQVGVANKTAVDGFYDPAGLSNIAGIWIVQDGGPGDSGGGVGIQLNNPFSHKFNVGVACGSQNGGPVDLACFRDDGTSTHSIDIRGSHINAIDTSAATGLGAAIKTGGNQSYGSDSYGGVLATWTSTAVGINAQFTAATYTDTANTGALGTRTVNSFGIPTLAASTPTLTIALAATVWIAGAPVAGSGVAISESDALYVNTGNVKLNTGNLTLVSGILTAPGGALTGLTTLAIRDTSAAFDVTLAATSSPALTAGRALTFNMENVAHILSFGTTANTGSGIIFPNTATDTVGMLGVANAWTAINTFSSATASTTTGTGAVVLSGAGAGIGIAGALNAGTFGTFGSYVRVGSNSAPLNTTAGDLTAGRLAIGVDTAFAPTQGIANFYGTTAITSPSSTYVNLYNFTNAAPASASSATVTGFNSVVNIATAVSSDIGTTRAQNSYSQWSGSGNATQLGGGLLYGAVLVDGSNFGTIATVIGSEVYSVYGTGFTKTGTITNAYGSLVRATTVGTGPVTITNNAGIAIEARGNGTNRTGVLIGTSTIPAGTWGIYNSSSNANYFATALSIGTTSAASAGGLLATGTIQANVAFNVNGNVGVSCTVGTLNVTTAVVVGGIITHC